MIRNVFQFIINFPTKSIISTRFSAKLFNNDIHIVHKRTFFHKINDKINTDKLNKLTNTTKKSIDTVINSTINSTPSDISLLLKNTIRKYDKSKLEIAKEVLTQSVSNNSSVKNIIVNNTTDIAMMMIVSSLNLGLILDVIELLHKFVINNADKNEQLRFINDFVNNNSISQSTIKEIIDKNTKYPELNDLLKKISYNKK